ncbi:MAG: LytR/AlgR family response regulator transcription factor [Flavicella sp.]
MVGYKKINIALLTSDQEMISEVKLSVQDSFDDAATLHPFASKKEFEQSVKEFNYEVFIFDVAPCFFNVFSFLEKYNDLSTTILYLLEDDRICFKALLSNLISDALIKPLVKDQLCKKIKNLINKSLFEREFSNSDIQSKYLQLPFLAVPSLAKIDFLKIESILYCEADGKYTTFYLENGTTIISSKNLGEYEKLLTHKCFFRIHHRYLINLTKVLRIDKTGGAYCVLLNENILPISKRKLDSLIRYLKVK